MEGLIAPLSRQTTASLRQAVHEHARTERRRCYAPVLHVGRPGGCTASLEVAAGREHDLGLCTDLVGALRVRALRTRALRAAGVEVMVWLTRAGSLELQDVDAHWLTAARAAFAEAQAHLDYVVVNRRGWRDPRTGLGRTWARIRPAPA